MKRILAAVAAAFGLVACVPLTSAPHGPPAPPKPVVLIYGDSLVNQSADSVRFFYGARNTFVFRAYPGTSACDWSPLAAADRQTYHPQRVVIAFTGNADACTHYATGGQAAFLASYKAAILQFHQAFSGLPMDIVLSIACNDRSLAVPHTNGLAALNAMYASLVDPADFGGSGPVLANTAFNPDAVIDLTPDGVFRQYGPAFPGSGPIVKLREADGVHLTPDGQDWYGWVIGQ